jgi:hypothetical protein
MANRLFQQFQGTLDKGVVMLQGSFAPDTANAPTTVKGKGFSVARTSTGLFTITLQDTYQHLISGQVSLQLAAGDDKFVQLGAVDVASAKTIQIRVWDISGGAVADIAANANNRINFSLLLKNSTV